MSGERLENNICPHNLLKMLRKLFLPASSSSSLLSLALFRLSMVFPLKRLTFVLIYVYGFVWVEKRRCLRYAPLNQRRGEGCALIIFHADLTYLPRLLFKACHCRYICCGLTATVWRVRRLCTDTHKGKHTDTHSPENILHLYIYMPNMHPEQIMLQKYKPS